MKLFPVISLCAAILPSSAEARYTTSASARYTTKEGQSSWAQTNVSFLTGMELNKLTSSLNYDSLKSYATIFFQNGNIAVIKIEEPIIFCGMEFDANCVPITGKMKGNDQEAREWETCIGLYC